MRDRHTETRRHTGDPEMSPDCPTDKVTQTANIKKNKAYVIQKNLKVFLDFYSLERIM